VAPDPGDGGGPRAEGEAELLRRLAERNHVLETLNRLGARLAGELELEKLVQEVTDAGREISGAEFGAFFYNVADSSGQGYMLYTLSGVAREAFSKFPMPRNTAVFAPTFSGEQTVRSDDITKDPRYGKNRPYAGMPPGHLPVRSYLAVPVVSRGGEVLGGLFYGHQTPGVFTEEHERTLAAVAAQASIAIDNARLVAAARSEVVGLREADETRARLAAIIDSSDDAIVSKDLNGYIMSWNAGAERIFGYSAAEAVGRHITMIIPPELRSEEDMILSRIRAGRRVDHFQTERVRKDGRRVLISVTISPIRDSTGRIVGASKVARDVTAQRESEDARARLAAIVESTSDAIIGKDLQGRITSWNLGASRIFGYSAEEVLGRSITMLIPEERRAEEQLILARISAGEHVDNFETERVAKDGRVVPMSLTVSPIRDSLGRVIGASKIGRDISERREIEARLGRHSELLNQAVQDARAELERTHQALRLAERLAALGTIAAGLGHDIGNLLLPLRARLEALRERHPSGPDAEDLEVIARCADCFQSLVRGLRMFSRGEEDNAEWTEARLWAEDAAMFLKNMVSKNITLASRVKGEVPPLAISPGALTQAVMNLVKNSSEAIGPDRAGVVHITVGLDAERGPWVEVADNGPGMPPHVRQRCMEPYFTTKTRGSEAGTGLGLSIVHRSISAAGGSVTIDSQPGGGTAVRLWVPRREHVRQERPRVSVQLSDPRLRGLVTALLRACDFEPTAAGAVLDPAAAMWVVDHVPAGRVPVRRMVVLAESSGLPPRPEVLLLPANPPAATLRESFSRLRRELVGAA
jgi:PAS domain S-box-containing protein